jgi:hypothetical protein
LNLLCVTKLTSNTIKINKVTYTCENVNMYFFMLYTHLKTIGIQIQSKHKLN